MSFYDYLGNKLNLKEKELLWKGSIKEGNIPINFNTIQKYSMFIIEINDGEYSVLVPYTVYTDNVGYISGNSSWISNGGYTTTLISISMYISIPTNELRLTKPSVTEILFNENGTFSYQENRLPITAIYGVN